MFGARIAGVVGVAVAMGACDEPAAEPVEVATSPLSLEGTSPVEWTTPTRRT